MKITKVFILTLSAVILSHFGLPGKNKHYFFQQSGAPKTVCIKTMASTAIEAYFSENKLFNFEIYKAGTKQELQQVLKAFANEAEVESCVAGKTTGDYQQIILKLKTNKDKKWFTSVFKKAGLMSIRYNHLPDMSLDKM